jgi:hypothetical protein
MSITYENSLKTYTKAGGHYIQDFRIIFRYISVSSIFVIRYRYIINMLCAESMAAIHIHV